MTAVERTFRPSQVPTRTLTWKVTPLAGNVRYFDVLGKDRDESGTAMEYRDYMGGGKIEAHWEKV